MRSLKYARVWLVLGFGLLAAVVYLTLTTNPPSVPGAVSDKRAHLLAYGVLMLWFAGVLRSAAYPVLALALVALGVVLEYLQGAMGVRMYEVADMVANGGGVMVGWVVAALGGHRWAERLERLVAARD